MQRRSGRTFVKWDTSQGWPWHYSDQLCEMLTPPGQDFSGANTHRVSDLKRWMTGSSFPEHRERNLEIKGCWVMYTGARPATLPMQRGAPASTATEAVTQFRVWEYRHAATFCTVFHSRHSVLMVLLIVCRPRFTESLSPPYRLSHTLLLYRSVQHLRICHFAWCVYASAGTRLLSKHLLEDRRSIALYVQARRCQKQQARDHDSVGRA